MKHTNEYVREQIRKKAFDDYDMSQVQIKVTKVIKLDDVLALLGAQEKELRERFDELVKNQKGVCVYGEVIQEFLGGGAEKEAHP